MVATVRFRRWRAGADNDCARIPIGSMERVAPTGGKAGRRRLIEHVVQILRAVARRFDDDDAAARGVEYGREVVRPPLHGNVAALIVALSKVIAWARTMHLEKDDVASPQTRRGLVDGAGGADRAV